MSINPNSKIETAYEGLTPLCCDTCGVEICKVSDFDLNGSYFYCNKCVSAEEKRRECTCGAVDSARVS